jgi:hypothetical protein
MKASACSFALCFGVISSALSFRIHRSALISSRNVDLTILHERRKSQEYRNAATQVLSNFMEKGESASDDVDPIDRIDFNAPKLSSKLDLKTLAVALDAELYEKEWFVTGNVNPIYFADSFRFEDPDVKLDGIEDYARGVYKLFDQNTARAEIIATEVSEKTPNTVTCTWRLSGRVKIGPGLTIKPYIVYTDFTVDPNSGLITLQEDRFSIPQWDILLSALFPFLIGNVASPPAPPVEPRVAPVLPQMVGRTRGPLAVFSNFFQNQ